MQKNQLRGQSEKYLLILFFCVLSLPLMVLIVDPMAFLPTPSPLDKFYARGSRIEKAWPLILNDYETLLAGTSRVQIGLDPQHPHFIAGKAYNLGFPTSAMPEIVQALHFAREHQDLKQLVVGLDFIAFNTKMPFHGEWEQSMFSGWQDYLMGLVRYSVNPAAMAFAVDNVKLNIVGSNRPYSDKFGFLDKSETDVDHYRVFRRVMTTQYLVLANFYADFDYNAKAIDSLEDVLTLYAQDGTDIKLYISPVHARHIEALMGLGLYPQFETWKRQLVKVAARVEERTNRKIDLWDFNVYSEVTCEEVPARGEKDRRMQWYFESSHFNKYAGNLIIETLFGLPPSHSLNGPFGYQIDRHNIEEHLQSVRSQRLEYNAANVAAVDDIKFLIKHTEKKREKFRTVQSEGL